MSARAWAARLALGAVVAGCGGAAAASSPSAARATAPAVPAAPPARPASASPSAKPFVALAGTDCAEATLPTWTYDPAARRLSLSQGDLSFRVPSGSVATIERPTLVVVAWPPDARGARPTFELFVSPLCKTYALPPVQARVAARAMRDVLAPRTTAERVLDGGWSAGMGGPVGMSVVLFDVKLETPRGEQLLDVWGTDYGETKTFGVHAAAACPKERPGDREENACERAYFEMLRSAGE
jgi:hypothetical protein